MKQTFKRSMSLFLALVMMVGAFASIPFTASAVGVDYNHNASTSTDEYYNLISKADWDNAPGITESEIVLNNDAGDYRQVIHIMKADVNNSYVNVIPTYNEMDTSKYQIATMLDQANWIDQNMDGEVIGVMNCCLSWYSGYAAERVGEPLGFMMMNGEIMFDPGNCGYDYGNVGFPTCVVINKDFDDNGNPRPADIPKVEMPQIRSAADLDGWEDTVIPISSGYIVKDGKNQYSTAHKTDAAPRSVVGITADGQVVMMENDGRQSPFSAGMNMYECAEVMIAAGCVFAANCDGGGSSTFVSQRPGEELKVNNSPSDGGLRPSTSGICFISTAPATGEFVKASVSTESNYYTPLSEVQFNAIGSDLVGTYAEIPDDVYWQVTEGMGTIDNNGLFVSSGKTGVATAELIYNGEVVGSASINIVIPDKIEFLQTVITVPNGEYTDLRIVAFYDTINEVTTKVADFNIVLSDATVGTINGYTFTATADLTVKGGSVTATLVHDTSKVAYADIRLGKASEVIWDFENGTDDWDTTMWKADSTRPYAYLAKSDVYSVNSTNGKVHNGNGAMALVADFTYTSSPTWNSFYLNYYGEDIVIENAQAIGCWLYIPDEIPYIEFSLRFYPDGSTSPKNALVAYGDTEDPLAPGWQFVSFDISKYKKIEFKSGYQFIQIYYAGIQGVPALKDAAEINSKVTYYIDDVTIDYSTAVADREAPEFTAPSISDAITYTPVEMNGQTVNTAINSFEVTVKDFVKDNATGINSATAKVYVDGNSIACKYSNGRISSSDVELANGVHTVTFEIADMSGNVARISRKIRILSESNDIPTINVVPHDASLDKLPLGSIYYVDINATNVEKTNKVVVTLDLNNHSVWELDNMEVANGFEATYVIDATDPIDKIATITITRVGESDIVGEGTLVSLPIRTWEWSAEESPAHGGEYDFLPEERWAEPFTCRTILRVEIVSGTLITTANETVPFGADTIEVDTELWASTCSGVPNAEFNAGFQNIGWHIHTVTALEDKAATCTQNGYTGRTFCEGCNSVVDWGTVVPATGHEYEITEGKLSCECGKLFNGEYTDGKTYIDGTVVADGWYQDTYYFINGVKVVGQKLINGVLCTFATDGTYLPDYSFTGFYHDGTGWTYYQGNFQKKGFVVIDGDTYYFDDRTGYAPVGSFTLAGDRVYKVEGEKGKVLGAWDTVVDNGVEYRRYYYSLRYYKNEWHEVDGEQYFFDNEGYALTGTRAVAAKGEYLGGYVFAADGRMIEAITGPFIDDESGYMYFAENGVMVCNKLVKYNDDYYFARSNYLLITWGTYISEEQANGLLPAGEYQFGEDGKLIMQNGPVADPYNPAYLNFYKNGVRVYEEGLYQYKGDYYYVRSNGLLLTWGMNITKTNGLLPAGEYKFGADGKLQMLNGPIEDAYNSAYLNFYKDGVRIYEEGLYEYNGDYYYVRSNGLLLTWGMNITKTNGLLPAGEYKFGADGKLQMLNGPVEDAYNSAYLNFYIDGVRIYEEGLYEFNGDYYYVRSNGLLLTWGMNITKTNGLLPAGEYKFGTDGKLQMLNGPVVDAYNSAYLNFYIDGVRIYEEGLYEFNGDYYYVRSNGLLLTWGMNITKTNGLLPAGEYKFGADGKLIMLNGPVVDALNSSYINFYIDGVRVYKEGLYEYNGDYYYVRSNGLLITWGTYVSEEKANGLLPAGDYQFGADGKMIK